MTSTTRKPLCDAVMLGRGTSYIDTFSGRSKVLHSEVFSIPYRRAYRLQINRWDRRIFVLDIGGNKVDYINKFLRTNCTQNARER